MTDPRLADYQAQLRKMMGGTGVPSSSKSHWYDKPLDYWLGPHASSLLPDEVARAPTRRAPMAALEGLLELSPAADMRDAYRGVGDISGGLLNLSPSQTMSGVNALGLGILGMMTAGRGDDVAKIGKEAAEAAMDAIRLRRAKEAGFRTDMRLFHGTDADIRAFDPAKSGRTSGSRAAPLGVWTALDPETANEFAEIASRQAKDGGPNVLPLLHRAKRPAAIDLTGDEMDHEIAATLADAFDHGVDSVLLRNYTTPSGKTGRNIIVVREPSQLRSVFAKFDPAKLKDSDLLASAVPAAAFLGFGALGMKRDGGVPE